MNYKILLSSKFEKEFKRLLKKHASLKSDFLKITEKIKQKPDFGTALGHNCYKIRMQISSKGKGKSGGARILTYVYISGKSVYLLSIYDKSEKENISTKELKAIIDALDL
jgi:mRNA-degrading endonuclease RelE of RelBE toxin-antitoxin system